MPYVPFLQVQPDLALRECLTFKLGKHPSLPADEYALTELYCMDPNCDCRRVMLQVRARSRPGRVLASVTYGFDRQGRDPGPDLDPVAEQSPEAEALFPFVADRLGDPAYVSRLERHYRLAKQSVTGPGGRTRPKSRGANPRRSAMEKGPALAVAGAASAALPAGASGGAPRDLEWMRKRVRELSLPRNAERPPGEFLERLLQEAPDAGAALASMTAYEADALIRNNAQILLFIACKAPEFSEVRRERVASDAVPILRAALKDPAVEDDRKYVLGPFLEACGVELPQAEYEACFGDFAATAERRNAAFLAEMSADMESVEQALRESGILGIEPPAVPTVEAFRTAFGFGLGLARHNPDAAAVHLSTAAAIATEHRLLEEDAGKALTCVAELGTPRAAWYLSELGAWPALGEFGDGARSLAEELGASGVAPCAPPTPTYSHGLVSSVDGAGSRSLTLFYRTTEGELDALLLILNESDGIRDAWCLFKGAANLEEDMRGVKGVVYAALAVPTARDLLGAALALHAKTETSPPGRLLLYRPFLGPEPIPVRPRRPNVGAYALELLLRDPELAADSASLGKDENWGQHWFSSDEAYAFVRAHFPGAGKAGAAARRSHRHPKITTELIDVFLRDVASLERELLIERMAANLETEAWAGRAGEPVNRLAARTWLVLSEELQPFGEVPYIRALARRAIEAIAYNLVQGFTTQRAANAAAQPELRPRRR
ncbi:MAG: hypothetical protein HYZ53_20595 [Planctomycetes bacterium]|nr:hypothetical protein [Planctomycetota bacterium]